MRAGNKKSAFSYILSRAKNSGRKDIIHFDLKLEAMYSCFRGGYLEHAQPETDRGLLKRYSRTSSIHDYL